jgi:hypothetical protein
VEDVPEVLHINPTSYVAIEKRLGALVKYVAYVKDDVTIMGIRLGDGPKCWDLLPTKGGTIVDALVEHVFRNGAV